MLHSAFLDFLETIYSNQPFFYSPSYSAFFSEHFIRRYYPFIFNLYFALFGGPLAWDCLIQTPPSSLYPISAPATRFFILSKFFLNKLTLSLVKQHIILFLDDCRALRAQNSRILLFFPYLVQTNTKCIVIHIDVRSPWSKIAWHIAPRLMLVNFFFFKKKKNRITCPHTKIFFFWMRFEIKITDLMHLGKNARRF
jgi:hypothetical protein